MQERRTVRVVLLSDQDRLLLMHVIGVEGEPIWVTIGGRIEEGEDLRAAAEREVVEETGLEGVIVGPLLGVGEQILHLGGEPTHLIESFVLALSLSEELSQAGWTAEERAGVLEMRWWSVAELLVTEEVVRPRSLAARVATILRGELSATPAPFELG